jgi:hypothetical protein
MIIGIDYDGTFSADPGLWRGFVKQAVARGHKCLCVTGRSDVGDLGDEVRRALGSLMPVLFAGLAWKRDTASAAGYDVDVWIDDNPEYVGEQDAALLANKVLVTRIMAPSKARKLKAGRRGKRKD